ncbi:MAG: tetratricopeptide repeat protein, partial [Pseudomonadota bacterium]
LRADLDAALATLRTADFDTSGLIKDTLPEDATKILAQKRKDIRDATGRGEAALARPQGALAFLHNTQDALGYYREATELDPTDPDGWNQLGNLYGLIGQLEDATVCYKKVQTIGTQRNNKEALAAAYGNLGLIAKTRGDLAQAETYSHGGM